MLLFGTYIVCEWGKKKKEKKSYSWNKGKGVYLSFLTLFHLYASIFYLEVTFIASKINYVVVNARNKNEMKNMEEF